MSNLNNIYLLDLHTDVENDEVATHYTNFREISFDIGGSAELICSGLASSFYQNDTKQTSLVGLANDEVHTMRFTKRVNTSVEDVDTDEGFQASDIAVATFNVEFSLLDRSIKVLRIGVGFTLVCEDTSYEYSSTSGLDVNAVRWLTPSNDFQNESDDLIYIKAMVDYHLALDRYLGDEGAHNDNRLNWCCVVNHLSNTLSGLISKMDDTSVKLRSWDHTEYDCGVRGVKFAGHEIELSNDKGGVDLCWMDESYKIRPTPLTYVGHYIACTFDKHTPENLNDRMIWQSDPKKEIFKEDLLNVPTSTSDNYFFTHFN